jgi:hypothetical protein
MCNLHNYFSPEALEELKKLNLLPHSFDDMLDSLLGTLGKRGTTVSREELKEVESLFEMVRKRGFWIHTLNAFTNYCNRKAKERHDWCFYVNSLKKALLCFVAEELFGLRWDIDRKKWVDCSCDSSG